MLALVNWGTFDSATGGTFQSDTDGTFHSDIPGTFESDMGGTFKVLQSFYYAPAKKSITRSIRVDAIVIPFFVSEFLTLPLAMVDRNPFAMCSFLLIGIG